MIEARVLADQAAALPPPAPGVVRIKAQPSADGQECRLMLDHVLLEGYSWCFDGLVRAAGSPLATALLGLEDVAQVTIDQSTLSITAEDDSYVNWRKLAARAGEIVRAHVLSGQPAVPPELVDEIPPEQEIQAALEAVIEQEINPGIAAHSGVVSLQAVRGNTVTITMGGGCQGCSAASITLRSGIYGAFRRAAPYVGAIYDATDHDAGVSPFFS